jgi:hypothetical protein
MEDDVPGIFFSPPNLDFCSKTKNERRGDMTVMSKRENGSKHFVQEQLDMKCYFSP